MRRRRLAMVVPVVMIVASACGGSDAGSDTAAETGEGIVSSPIAEFLGYDTAQLNDPQASQAKFNEDERARQELIAACMKEQGFDYIPVDPSQYSAFSSAGAEEYGSDEWVAKYGFGITTQRWPQSSVGPNLIGYDDAAMNEQSTVTDPNQAVVEKMSPEEQPAYYAALYGDQASMAGDETVSEEEATATTAVAADLSGELSGCQGKAYAESGDQSNAFYQEFSDELDAMYQRAQNDPRIVEVEKKVSDCVAGKGLQYVNSEELYTSFETDLSAIDEMIQPAAELSEEEMAKMSPEELNAFFSPELSEEAKAKLGELQKKELALAKAVNECGGGADAQSKLYQEVIAEYEQQFLDDNADQVAEFKSKS